MGANSTFFFQPGVSTRNNPLTPENNYVLTHKIAGYHAKYLDKNGVSYFSEEQFDDYYLGKGSSYPDINSGIEILFEQAGFRGRIRETWNGIRKLTYGIRNQFTVTLLTLDAAMNLKDELLDHQKEFYKEALRMTEKVSDKNLEQIKNAPVVSVQSVGKGKIISYHESMTFRGIWLGTNKLLANGVFFGKVIQ